MDIMDYFNDENITCSGELSCCYGNKSSECIVTPDSGCSSVGGEECGKCKSLPDVEPCGQQFQYGLEGESKKINDYDSINFDGNGESKSYSAISFSPDEICDPNGRCTYYEAGYINVKVRFTCTDKKYQISILPLGDRYLKFTIDAQISLQKKGINQQIYSCGGTPPNCFCGPNECGGTCGIIIITTTVQTTVIPTTVTTIVPTTVIPTTVTTIVPTTVIPTTVTTIRPTTIRPTTIIPTTRITTITTTIRSNW
jgi:hypothetical protein